MDLPYQLYTAVTNLLGVSIPLYTAVLGFMLWIILHQQYTTPRKGTTVKLSPGEIAELIKEWDPEPLVPKDFVSSTTSAPYVLRSFVGGGDGVGMGVRVEGSEEVKTLWCSGDYLGLGASARVREESKAALEKFTVGSCGPRGFYGTTTSHLELERRLAAFLGTEESITYSDPTATVVSVIPAFAKRGDVLLIDSEANYGIQQGARLSRSKVVWWEHNNMAALEAHLKAVNAADEGGKEGGGAAHPSSSSSSHTGGGQGGGSRSGEQRRFIVVEGLYASTGTLCDLPAVMRLAHAYMWRVILDDSCAFGVLGPGGRGTAEHYGMPTGEGPHVTVGSLSTSLGSVGGFCVGSREVVDHQRLSGVGYCFSASAPPYLCSAAAAALGELVRVPSLVGDLAKKSAGLHEGLVKGLGGEGFEVVSHPLSPTKHLRLVAPPGGEGRRRRRQRQRGEGGEGEDAPHPALSTPPSLKLSTSNGGGGGEEVGEHLAAAPPSPLPTTHSALLTKARMMSPTTQKLPAVDAAVAAAIAVEEGLLDQVVARAAAKGVLLTRSHAIPGEPFTTRPTLKLHVTLRHTEGDCAKLVNTLRELSKDPELF